MLIIGGKNMRQTPFMQIGGRFSFYLFLKGIILSILGC